MTALLDTHVLVWWLNDRRRLSAAQRDVVASAGTDSPLLVSDISLWEVAMLHDRGRIRLTLPLREWLEKATGPPSSGDRGSHLRLQRQWPPCPIRSIGIRPIGFSWRPPGRSARRS